MTHLRKMMLEELQRRNYSENTTRHYIPTVEDFAKRFKRSPDRLGPEHIREYQAELFKRKLSPGTVTQRLAALRFFYIKTLKRAWSIAETPYPKTIFHLPTILSQEEVGRLIDAALTSYHHTLLMTLYATGVRRAELTHLKVSDIDSQRMVIHVRGGKGRKDRDVMLSPKLLEELREHWRRLKPRPSTWLFPGSRWHTSDTPIDTKVVWYACQQAAQRAGIQKNVHPHTLRHCFATHLLIAAPLFWLASLFVLFLLRALLRKEWAAAIAWVLLFTVFNPAAANQFAPVVLAVALINASLNAFLLIRFGLLVLVAAEVFNNILGSFPLTTQMFSWYASLSLAGILLLAAMALYAFYTSLGGRPVFGRTVLEE